LQTSLNNISYDKLLESFILNASQSFEKQWDYDEDIDFEKIYQKHRCESTIDELFDQLISQLVLIIERSNIEDDILNNGIQKIVAVIKQNKGKSYYSDQSLITWVVVFMKNVVIGALKEIPGLKIIIEGIENTLTELNREIATAGSKTSKEIVARTNVSTGILYGNSGQQVAHFQEGDRIKLLV
jgi:hypothetical protein